MNIYLIGSLRNPEVPKVAAGLRAVGHTVFDDWYAAGEIADDSLRDYERQRGHTYAQALDNYAAQHILAFDRYHLNRCHAAVLLYPAGRSCHMELGYVLGQGKPGYVLLDAEPERFDIMMGLATGICATFADLTQELAR